MKEQIERMRGLANLPGYNDKPKYSLMTKVTTPLGDRIITTLWGKRLINGQWVQLYVCVKMNKDGTPNRKLRRNGMNVACLETQISPL